MINQPPISRVVREVLSKQKTAETNMLVSSTMISADMLARMHDANAYIEQRKSAIHHNAAEIIAKHSTVSMTVDNDPMYGSKSFIYRSECFVFTKNELMELLSAVEKATYDALNPIAKWGPID